MAKAGSQLTIKARRRVLAFADRVSELAVDSPNDHVKGLLYQAANQIRQQYGFSDVEKKAELWRLVNLGAATIADLINETLFHKDEVHRLTREMEAAGTVVFRRMQHLGVGRPQICIFPNQTPQSPQKQNEKQKNVV